jgi:glycosyltransferase involved in cell wall biosynthesis
MTTRLRIYLAGPIRGCNDEQKTWWRNEVKQLLKKDFDFEDPTEWADDFVLSREIAKLEACDILLANMWKESIGTTLGIVRARHQGKPVILVDPNRINNAILNGLVSPEAHVHTMAEACARLRVLAAEFKPFVVLKKNGTQEAFSTKKVVQSVSLAAAAAGVAD